MHSPNSILNQPQAKEMPEFEMRDGYLVQRMGAGRRGSGWSENEEKADEVDVSKPVSPLMGKFYLHFFKKESFYTKTFFFCNFEVLPISNFQLEKILHQRWERK